MKRQRMTQTARVEQLLRRRGELGITAADFLLPDVADGGPPILRLAARVDELRSRHGVTIVTLFEHKGDARVARYVLREQHFVTASMPVNAPDASDQLLAPPPRSAVLGWEEA
ncbi:hypothetical protein DSM104299_00983 [Baekduia alba]|uniref:helix-turn-helix domain-containing protein n=1 Tax=Baekduia alba TaxID=2997333 RepID=UPI0023401A61|nr:helix-turn-helix domain-containing protein [Baekduia alba]WCB92293.1 hypothetical protein DSM104299_00983 [Baekduia alba]